jgi:hypothetical protein
MSTFIIHPLNLGNSSFQCGFKFLGCHNLSIEACWSVSSASSSSMHTNTYCSRVVFMGTVTQIPEQQQNFLVISLFRTLNQILSLKQ